MARGEGRRPHGRSKQRKGRGKRKEGRRRGEEEGCWWGGAPWLGRDAVATAVLARGKTGEGKRERAVGEMGELSAIEGKGRKERRKKTKKEKKGKGIIVNSYSSLLRKERRKKRKKY